MTLYYTLVFIVLIIEMIFFLLLVAPVPQQIHTRLIRAFRTPAITQVMRSIKFLFVFILVLFVDSLQRVYNGRDLDLSSNSQLTVADRSDYQARKFYNQRNMYLCGFTLFLSLILNRTYTLVKANSDLRLQLGTGTGGDGKGEYSLKAQDYKERLERKKKQFKALEEQSASLQKEYFRVCDELKELKGQNRFKKED